MSPRIYTIFLAIGLILTAGIVSAQSDPIGQVDTVTLYIENLSENKWKLTAHVFNDEELAALEIPLKFTAGIAKLFVDSVSFTGSRIDFFEMKNSRVDTTSQTMKFGGIAYISPNKPPLAAGNGEVGTVYFSVRDKRKPGPFAVDTTTFPPNSTLLLVDVNAKSIVPVLKIVEVKPEAAPKKK